MDSEVPKKTAPQPPRTSTPQYQLESKPAAPVRRPPPPVPNRQAEKPAPVIFSKPTVNPEALKTFLNHVARGEQDEAEALLKKDNNLALAKGDLQDQAGRAFKDITAFQYAVWALDWHMWKMIRKYLPNSDAKTQLEGLERGSWVSTHGFSAKPFLESLINALQTVMTLLRQGQYDKADEAWVKQVGGAQKCLPAHVVNEYCHPTRSFDPTPSFREETLPRSQKTEKSNWWVAVDMGSLLGEKWAVGRWRSRTAAGMQSGGGRFLRYKWPAPTDHRSCVVLLNVRLAQQQELVNELQADVKRRP